MSVGIYSWPKTNTSLLLASCWFHYSWKGACSVIKHAIGFSVLHTVIVLTSSERVDMPSLISPSLSVDFQVWSGLLFLHGNATCHFNHIVKVYPCISHLLSNLFPGVVKWESYIHTLIYISVYWGVLGRTEQTHGVEGAGYRPHTASCLLTPVFTTQKSVLHYSVSFMRSGKKPRLKAGIPKLLAEWVSTTLLLLV